MSLRSDSYRIGSPVQRLIIVPVASAVLLFLAAPILIVIPMSFSGTRYLQFPPESWSLRWYYAYFSDPGWMEATQVSVSVAIATTILTVPLGIAAAYGLHNLLGARKFIELLLMAPLIAPSIITAIGVFFIFTHLGLVGTSLGLVVAYVMLSLPYMIVTMLAGLRTFDNSQELAARSLGMNRLRSFWHVTLPQLRTSTLSGALFVFVTALDEAVVAVFVSAGPNATLTKRMFNSLRDEIDPTIAAISALLITFTVSVLILSATISRQKSVSTTR